ncbi:MAG TPA: helix-turn-helix domain-containing protein [Bryobacteraceae bacterium]|jgi:hypothetical protein
MRTQPRHSGRKRARLSDRGLGPRGGGWSIAQGSAWSGIGERKLREMAKRGVFLCHSIGRRIVIPRQAFIDWFNGRSRAA